MRATRYIQRLRAEAGGYFWADCPLCGEWFGGHEWRSGDALVTGPGTGTAICPNHEPGRYVKLHNGVVMPARDVF